MATKKSKHPFVMLPLRQRRELLDHMNAAEFGFSCCEKGWNIQKTLDFLKAQYFSRFEKKRGK